MGTAALGTTLSFGGTDVAEVVDITGPSLSVDTADTTNHDTQADHSGWEELVTTIKRSGEVTFDINYLPGNSSHGATSGLLNELDSKSKSSWTLTFPDSTTWTFDAYVTGFEPSAPHDDSLDASITLKPTGAMTLN